MSGESEIEINTPPPDGAGRQPPSNRVARPLWQRILLGLLWLIWLVPVIQTTYLSEKYVVNCPVADDWVLVGQYVAKIHEGGKLTWKDMMESYVHSRSPIPKIVGVVQAELSGYDVKWGTRTTLLLTLGSLAAAIWLIVRAPFIGTWEKPFFAAFAAFFIFSPFQQTQWLVGALASNTMGITPVIVCIVLWSSRMNFWVKYGLSLALAIFASLSFISGLVIWLFPPLLLWFTLPAPSRKVRLTATLVWLGGFGLCVVLYFHGLEAGQSSMGLQEAIANWHALLVFVLSVLGVPVGFDSKMNLETIAVTMSLCYLGLLLVTLAVNWRYLTSSEGLRQAMPWFSLIAFAGGNAMLLALGRLNITNAAFFTRYAAYTAFFYIGWLGIMRLSLAAPAKERAGWYAKIGLLVAAVALLGVSSRFYANTYREGVFKTEFKHYDTIQLKAAVEFVNAFPDIPMLTHAAWDDPRRIIVHAPPLARAGMLKPGLITSPYLKDNTVFLETDPANTFRGATEKSEAAEAGVSVSGWCIGKVGNLPPDLVLVTAAPAGDPASEQVVSITMERVRRKDIVKKYKTNYLNGRYGWKVTVPNDKLPSAPAILRAYVYDTDTLDFHRLAGEIQVP